MNSVTNRFVWSDRYLLGYAPMDRTHQEFVTLVDYLLSAENDELSTVLDAFARHASRHFGEEEQWMLTNDFPPRDCHIDEHNKVLASLNEVREELSQGNFNIVRSFAEALVDWFPAHADYMDSALAAWMVKKDFNGKPLVFRKMSEG